MGPKRIVVLGGGGFVGRHVVARLVAADYRVVVPTRRRESAKHLILLPTVDVVEADVHDENVLSRLFADAAAVVNLVGIIHEDGADTFERVHVELPRKVIAACRAAGVARLLHMSALGASADAPSKYLRGKAAAEAMVAASGLQWTIFRPSVVFGREDAFLNLFARLSRALPIVALASPKARFQPVYVGDVAHCFVQAVDDDITYLARYDLCGPKVYTLQELVTYVGETAGAVRPIFTLGPGLSKLQAAVLEHLPGKLMTRDNLLSMKKDNVCDCPFPAVFGIAPATLESVAPSYLSPGAQRSPFDPYRANSGR
ncbi:MAG TPA: complex I NDUFA9 subunit family protein [Casimicrobiaceae bacterium]|nr:complex I NDUFA9 subunit family protein [Casimicrobiaceae bacterium]